MFKNDYYKTALSIYISYAMLGMILIMLSCHMTFLTKQLNTDAAGISFLISTEGLARAMMLYAAGKLSDKFGRKKVLCVAPIAMIIFLVGIPLSPNYHVAMFFTIFMAISHACMDASSYPTLIECFPKSSGTATVIVKAFVSTGASILPFIIAFFVGKNMFYGSTFFLIALIVFLNGLFLFGRKFPKANDDRADTKDGEEPRNKFISKPDLKREGLALIIIGFTSNSLLMGFQIWIPTYGQIVLGLNEIISLKLITYYGVGSLISVLILAKLLQKTIKPISVLVIYPMIGLATLVMILTTKSETTTIIGFFMIGMSSAGVLQMAQTTMGEFFWNSKGEKIALVSTASGVGAAVIPGLTGLILRHSNVMSVFYFMIAIYVIAIVCASYAKFRYDKLTKLEEAVTIEN